MASRGDMKCFEMEVTSYKFLNDKISKEYKNNEKKKAIWELKESKFEMSG